MTDDGWLNNGMPFFNHVFNGKTGRQIARENLKKWAAEGKTFSRYGMFCAAVDKLNRTTDREINESMK